MSTCEHGYRPDECATCWKSVPGALGDTCDWGACAAKATRRVRMTHGIAPERHDSAPIRPLCDVDARFVVAAMGGVDVGAVPPPAPPKPPRLAGLSPTETRDLAIAHGWEFLRTEPGGTQFTVRRMHLMPTPEHVLVSDEAFGRQPFMHWPEPTYHQIEFLTFGFVDRRLRGQVFYGHARGPWLDNARSTVSQRRAAEILVAPPPAEAITDTTPSTTAGGGA